MLVHPALERLRNESGETAHLAVLSGTDVVYVDRLESPHMMPLLTRVGRRRAAHATSSGKCLLAFGAAGRRRPRVAGGLPRLGPRTITSARCSSGRWPRSAPTATPSASTSRRRGSSSVAAPIFDRAGDCIAAISVAGPITRMPPEQLDRFARLVAAATARLSTVPEAPVSLARRS